MVRVRCLESKVAMFALLLCALLLDQVLACNTSNKRFNKQDRYFRRHNHRRYFGKRSADDFEKTTAADSTLREKHESFVLNTSCGDVLCESALDYPHDAIQGAVKQLRQIYESKETFPRENIDPTVLSFLSGYLNPEESPIDSPDIVYEASKGCKAIGNVSFPQEGFSNDDGKVYFLVNVPDLKQKANLSHCKKSKTECGDADVELPATYSRTCQQVHRDEEFLALPSNGSQYDAADFRVRTFQVPDGCKCVLLHIGDYEFLRDDCKKEK